MQRAPRAARSSNAEMTWLLTNSMRMQLKKLVLDQFVFAPVFLAVVLSTCAPALEALHVCMRRWRACFARLTPGSTLSG